MTFVIHCTWPVLLSTVEVICLLLCCLIIVTFHKYSTSGTKNILFYSIIYILYCISLSVCACF